MTTPNDPSAREATLREREMRRTPIGSRVELHPACDAWMRGDRFGTVVAHGSRYVHVLCDRSGRVRTLAPRNVNPA